MSLEQILAEVRKYGAEYVCVTGGEPLGQRGVYPLMKALLDDGYIVSLETNGAFSIKDVPDKVIKVVDLKCPDSGEAKANVWENTELVKPHDQFKFVIGSKEDFDWSQQVCEKYQLHSKCPILYTPVHGKVQPADLAHWILDSHAKVTMQTQLHKEIWGPNQRGV